MIEQCWFGDEHTIHFRAVGATEVFNGPAVVASAKPSMYTADVVVSNHNGARGLAPNSYEITAVSYTHLTLPTILRV